MKQNSFTYDQLIDCAKGVLFGKGNAQLPMPPMLMFDRITSINENGGVFAKGEVIAELDIKEDLWFFECHFKDDPVMPGALGVGEVKFTGQVLQKVKKVTYHISLKRLILRKLILGVGDGILKADGETIYEAKDMKVGLFSPEK
jgi:3-hydroxyacyl-[acyl-carrier protein] dehydratase/trans-2-decenoyl-[acyl-carrier protein] isomerase